MAARRTLIAGGDGFLGRALTRRLLDRGDYVWIIDDHSTSQPQAAHPRLVVHEADVCATKDRELPSLDAVLHFASPAAPALFVRRTRVVAPNVQGTQCLLDLARQWEARFIYASSSEVYGLAADVRRPFGEDDPFHDQPHSARACYAAAKRLGEELVVAARDDGVDALALRIFNVYGPGMDPTISGDGRVIPNFLRAVRRGEALPIYGDGQQVRSFLWIEDFVDAVVTLLDHPQRLPTALNLGRDEPVRVLDLADAVEHALGCPVARALHVRPAQGTRWRRPDCTRLRDLTGWVPKVALHEGLRQLVTGAEDLGEVPCP